MLSYIWSQIIIERSRSRQYITICLTPRWGLTSHSYFDNDKVMGPETPQTLQQQTSKIDTSEIP